MYNLMKRCNNFFEKTAECNTFTITECASDCVISGVKGKYLVGQYIRVMNSLVNDGVYKIKGVEGEKLTLDAFYFGGNETFNGYVVGLAVPKAFIDLSEKVKAYENKRHITSESVQGFYSVSFNRNAKDGYDAYAGELAVFQKGYISEYYFLNWVKKYER